MTSSISVAQVAVNTQHDGSITVDVSLQVGSVTQGLRTLIALCATYGYVVTETGEVKPATVSEPTAPPPATTVKARAPKAQAATSASPAAVVSAAPTPVAAAPQATVPDTTKTGTVSRDAFVAERVAATTPAAAAQPAAPPVDDLDLEPEPVVSGLPVLNTEADVAALASITEFRGVAKYFLDTYWGPSPYARVNPQTPAWMAGAIKAAASAAGGYLASLDRLDDRCQRACIVLGNLKPEAGR